MDPSKKRAISSAPLIGRRATPVMPPPSLIEVTCGSSTRIIASRSPCSHAWRNAATSGACSAGSVGRARRVCRCAGGCGQLTGLGSGAAEDLRDFGVGHTEDLVQDMGHPLGGSQSLEHHQQGHVDALMQGDVLQRAGLGGRWAGTGSGSHGPT